MANALISGVIEDLRQTLLELHNSQRLSRLVYDLLSEKNHLETLADALLSRRKHTHGNLQFELVTMKAIAGSDFPFVRILFKEDVTKIRRMKLRAFLGHRFLPHITQPLRFNLARICDPYGIRLNIAGQEAASEPLFADIIKKLRSSDFAIFDNRETETKPNVYIEIGMSYVLGLPFIVCDYRDPNRPEFDPLPSDLSGFLTLRYSDYKSLATELALKLPLFVYQRVRPAKRK